MIAAECRNILIKLTLMKYVTNGKMYRFYV